MFLQVKSTGPVETTSKSQGKSQAKVEKLKKQKKEENFKKVNKTLEEFLADDSSNKNDATLDISEESCLSNILPDETNNVSDIANIIDKEMLKCPYCGKNDLENRLELAKHFDRIHAKNSVFECKWCTTSIEGGLSRALEHMSKFHPKKSPLDGLKSLDIKREHRFANTDISGTNLDLRNQKVSCPECGKLVALKSLNRHVNLCKHPRVKNCCKICKAVFDSYNQLTKHKREAHNIGVAKKQLVCEICGAKFTGNYALKHHISDVHENRRDHLCDICGEGFKYPSVLKKHKQRHTGERPFMCKICTKTFIFSGEAKKHCKRMHGVVFTSRMNCPFNDEEKYPIAKLDSKKSKDSVENVNNTWKFPAFY